MTVLTKKYGFIILNDKIKIEDTSLIVCFVCFYIIVYLLNYCFYFVLKRKKKLSVVSPVCYLCLMKNANFVFLVKSDLHFNLRKIGMYNGEKTLIR